MYIATYHNTLLACDSNGMLCQVDPDEDLAAAIQVDHITGGQIIPSGPLTGYRVSTGSMGLTFEYAGHFLCAEGDLISAATNRSAVGPWESFRAIPAEEIERLSSNGRREMKRFARRVRDLRAAGNPVKVYFGAGTVPIPNFLNVDIEVMCPEFAVQNSDWYFTFPYIGNRIDIPDNSIDFIFDEDLVEHVDQLLQVQYLAETCRILKPGCYHRVNTPSFLHAMKLHSSFSNGADGVYTGELKWGHVALFSHQSLKEMAELVGYSEVIFNGRGTSVSAHAIRDRRPGDDRDDVLGNIYADLQK